MKIRAMSAVFILLMFLSLIPVCAAQEPGYFEALGKTFTRGIKNMVSFPWEIPSTIARHDREDDGNPRAFRDMAGFFDGTFRSIARLSCGVWDILFSPIPGQQEGLPLKPEAFF